MLQPYQLVKDLRSGYEVGNVNGVLDGDLDGLMEAYLRWKRAASDRVTQGTLASRGRLPGARRSVWPFVGS